jgi:hypothetical protein
MAQGNSAHKNSEERNNRKQYYKKAWKEFWQNGP